MTPSVDKMDKMDNIENLDNPLPGTEAELELETFRRQWREEVSARNNKQEAKQDEDAPKQRRRSHVAKSDITTAGPSTARRKDKDDYSEELEPRTYHDLPDKDEQLLRDDDDIKHRNLLREPSSALEHYERAVEKETQGNLSESMRYYRKAFKLDDGVHEAYKRKHFPPSSFVKSKPTNPSNSQSSNTPPNIQPSNTSLHGSGDNSTSSLISSFNTLRIEPTAPPTDASPPEKCPIAELPEELLIQILTTLAITDIAAFAQVPRVCKRLAYLTHTESNIWKRVALGSEWGLASQHYTYACTIEGTPLDTFTTTPHLLPSPHSTLQEPYLSRHSTLRAPSLVNRTEQLLQTTYSHSYRQMFRSRPRLRFAGVYISTVNYTRAGGPATNTLTWGNPIHLVTYFRYLRFFRDGSLISLLTTSEPADVVHHLTKENLHAHNHHSSLPSAVMKDALSGRWRLTGEEEGEEEGEVCVETQGVVPKYVYVMRLVVSSAGRRTWGNKLAWKGFWSWNRLTEDWGRFELRNDRAFYWSRVGRFE